VISWLRPWFRNKWQSVQALRHSPALAWLGPALHHPRLWHVTRHGIAIGAAIGGFIGVIVPFGQMPLAALLAVNLRANLPTAVLATFVTNPFTTGAVYWLAYELGSLLGIGDPQQLVTALDDATFASLATLANFETLLELGKATAAGLALMAVACSLAGYFGVHWFWRFRVAWAWRQRGRRLLRSRLEE
jgi:uncharacterized protein